MDNSDLVELLAALQAGERKRLQVYLETAESGQPVRADSIRAVHYVMEKLENTDNQQPLSKTDAYTYIFPGKEFVTNKLEKTMSDALQVVRNFIASEAAGQKLTAVQKAYYLQKFYHERNLEKKFKQSRAQLEKITRSHEGWSPQDYYFQFLSEVQEVYFQSARNLKKDDLNLWKTIQSLDEYYLVDRLRLTCLLLNQNQLAPLALPALSEWVPFDLKLPQLAWFFEKPIGQIFSAAIEILSNPAGHDEQKLSDFNELIAKFESQIWPDQLAALEVFACNYGIRRLNRGFEKFAALIFQIQKRRVTSGRIYMDGRIRSSEFQSITALGLRIGEFEWVSQFLEENRLKVSGTMASEEYYQYNQALYLFYLKDYEPALKTLLTTSYEEMQYKLSSKILEIKILWEMSHRDRSDDRVSEFLENKVEAAIIYFFREKNLPEDKKKLGKRFADTMKRIIHAESKRDVERLQIILEDISKAEYIAERQWLSKLVEGLVSQFTKK